MTTVYLKERKGKKGTTLHLKWWINGKWEYDFLKLSLTGDRERDKTTRRKAEDLRRNKEDELGIEYGIAPAYKKKIPFVDFFEDISKTKKSVSWKTGVGHLKKFPLGGSAIGNITDAWLEKYKEFLLDKMSPNSAAVQFGNIKCALGIAAKKKVISYNPGLSVDPIKKEETEIDHLDEAEIQRMAATECRDPEVKRAFLFGCFSGLRISDIELLKWKNIEDGKLKFKQKKTGGYEYFDLSEPALKLLHQGQPENIVDMPGNFIFKLKHRVWVYRIMKEWVRAAGIRKDIHFHCSRHSFAIMLLQKGIDIYTVSKMLGHRNIKTTLRYLELTDAKKKEAAASLNDINIQIG